MSAETTVEKAHRLLVGGLLTVEKIGDPGRPGLIVAKCQGDSGVLYTLGFDPSKNEWRCTCAEMRGGCSHLMALRLVVVSL